MNKTTILTLLAGIALLAIGFSTAIARPSLVGVSTTSVSSAKIDDSGNTTEIKQVITIIEGTIPVPVGTKNVLMISPTYQHHKLTYNNFQSENGLLESDMPDELHTAQLAVGLVHRLSGGWTITGRVSGGIKSDFEDISSEDSIYGGLLSFTKNFDKKNNIGLGLAYNDSFGAPQIIPLLMFKWTPSDKVFVEGSLPVNLTAGYKPTEKLTAGIGINVKGDQYRLSKIGTWEKGILNVTRIQAGPFIDYRFLPKTGIKLSGGVVTGQKLEFKDRYDSEKILSEKDLEDSSFISLSLYVPF